MISLSSLIDIPWSSKIIPRVVSWRQSLACCPLKYWLLAMTIHSSGQLFIRYLSGWFIQVAGQWPSGRWHRQNYSWIRSSSRYSSAISSDLRFDRSILAGEGDAVAASTEPSNSNCEYIFVFHIPQSNYVRRAVMESRNITLQGTLCTSGNGIGVCVGLGDHTVFGRIVK